MSEDDLTSVAITPALIHTLLKSAIRKAETKVPSVENPVLLSVVRQVEMVKFFYKGWSGPIQDDVDTTQKVRSALQTLLDCLPRIQDIYAWEAQSIQDAAKKWPESADEFLSYAVDRDADLKVVESLAAAVTAVTSRGIPHDQGWGIPVIKRRSDFDEMLFRFFLSVFPTAGDAAGHRFVVAITPYITGEKPSEIAVRKNLSRK